VRSRSGEVLGTVDSVETMPAGDVYRVTGQQGSFYIPAAGDIIVEVDLARGLLVIDDREGLR